MRYKNRKKHEKNRKKTCLHGRYKKSDFFGAVFNFSYHGKSPCKGVFFITKNGLFVQLRSQSLFYFFNFFYVYCSFLQSQKAYNQILKCFFQKKINQNF